MAGSGLYDASTAVSPEPALLGLVPVYLDRRRDDVVSLREALGLGDFERVRILGHSMKDSGGGYGFDGITEIGLRLEGASKTGGAVAALEALDDLRSYLRNVVVIDA